MGRENKTPVDRMKHLDEILDEYEIKLGLTKYLEKDTEDDSKKYLSLSRDQMEKMTVEQCAEAALILGGLSYHLQRSYNREITRVNWATNILKQIISGKEIQYKGSWESQFQQAIKENDYAKKVLNIKEYAQQRADRITYLGTAIKNMSDLFVNLQRAKVMK